MREENPQRPVVGGKSVLIEVDANNRNTARKRAEHHHCDETGRCAGFGIARVVWQRNGPREALIVTETP